MSRGVRIDELLVERGLAPTRQKARALVLAGLVVAGDRRVDKPGQRVDPASEVRLKGEHCPYVSRGGLKLEAGLRAFGLRPEGRVCADVGASTGGFTDCLLQHGARRVYAIDVGYGQLAWKLRQDPRVVSLERQNIRTLPADAVPEPVDLAVVDTSFISLALVLPRVWGLLRPGGEVVALVKPQFEVGREHVGKGGVVRDPELRRQALERVLDTARRIGYEVLGTVESPVPGAKKGNVEFLAHLLRPGTRGETR
ncbi:TlyA family RNA methyltransferase [Deferrisoma camini]|uniref:TlyA family RNA methyltransferase n=1 Tax=Deferrisoma camini TaxID=1035120 RepID=UPI00046C8D89|nr:TlyA family RNA methyltransferase [Deferrisoma camini]